MIPIALIPEQRAALDKARRIRTAHLAERCVAVLLAARGHRVPTIAESLGRHAHTIRRWLTGYLNEGIAGLKDTPPAGRTNRTELAALPMLPPVFAKPPSADGSLEAGWSTNLLVADLSHQGLQASESTVQRALKRGGWV